MVIHVPHLLVTLHCLTAFVDATHLFRVRSFKGAANTHGKCLWQVTGQQEKFLSSDASVAPFVQAWKSFGPPFEYKRHLVKREDLLEESSDIHSGTSPFNPFSSDTDQLEDSNPYNENRRSSVS